MLGFNLPLGSLPCFGCSVVSAKDHHSEQGGGLAIYCFVDVDVDRMTCPTTASWTHRSSAAKYASHGRGSNSYLCAQSTQCARGPKHGTTRPVPPPTDDDDDDGGRSASWTFRSKTFMSWDSATVVSVTLAAASSKMASSCAILKSRRCFSSFH